MGRDAALDGQASDLASKTPSQTSIVATQLTLRYVDLMIKAHLILSQTRLIFSRLTDFSSVLTEFNSIWSDFWSDSDPNPIQTRPAPRPGYIRNKTLKIPFHPQTGRERVWLSHWAISGDSSGDLFFLSRSLYFLRRSSSDAGQLRRTHFSSDFSSAHRFVSLFVIIRQGGLVKAGLDVAQIWLDGDETLVNTIDRDGNMLPINMTNGHALTRDPLVVLGYLPDCYEERNESVSRGEIGGEMRSLELSRVRGGSSEEVAGGVAGNRPVREPNSFAAGFGVKWNFRFLFLIYPGRGAGRVWIGFGSESDQKLDQIELNSVKTDEKSANLLKIRRV
ncbi:hypothetical protein LXL04_008735 [Taraxacum kok-saghyz]